MAKGTKPSPTTISTHGYKPTANPGGVGNVQGGHVPTTGQGGSSTPPNQGGSGKK